MSRAMHVESKSYFDWNQQFLKLHPQEVSEEATQYKPKKVNSLGISEKEFTNLVKKWKEKNQI